jgi:hypothetical protein
MAPTPRFVFPDCAINFTKVGANHLSLLGMGSVRGLMRSVLARWTDLSGRCCVIMAVRATCRALGINTAGPSRATALPEDAAPATDFSPNFRNFWAETACVAGRLPKYAPQLRSFIYRLGQVFNLERGFRFLGLPVVAAIDCKVFVLQSQGIHIPSTIMRFWCANDTCVCVIKRSQLSANRIYLAKEVIR